MLALGGTPILYYIILYYIILYYIILYYIILYYIILYYIISYYTILYSTKSSELLPSLAGLETDTYIRLYPNQSRHMMV